MLRLYPCILSFVAHVGAAHRFHDSILVLVNDSTATTRFCADRAWRRDGSLCRRVAACLTSAATMAQRERVSSAHVTTVLSGTEAAQEHDRVATTMLWDWPRPHRSRVPPIPVGDRLLRVSLSYQGKGTSKVGWHSVEDQLAVRQACITATRYAHCRGSSPGGGGSALARCEALAARFAQRARWLRAVHSDSTVRGTAHDGAAAGNDAELTWRVALGAPALYACS